MSGLKKVSGVSTAHHRTAKIESGSGLAPKAGKAPKMPKPDKTAVPKMPHIKAGHGAAGTSKAHHQSQVMKAMASVKVPRPHGGNAVPGVPIGNPAPGPSNAFE